jgi:hypothetical protein
MRIFNTALITLGAVAQASPAAAMDGMGGFGGACQSLCVGYTTTVAQSVPLSPGALALMALILAVAAFAMLRGRTSRLLAIALAAILSSAALMPRSDLAHAGTSLLPTISFSTGNPAGPIIFSGSGDYLVTNDLSQPATLTSIMVSPPYMELAYPAVGGSSCYVGLLLAPGASCTVTLASLSAG